MSSRRVTAAAFAALVLVALFALFIKTRGFRASSTPGAFETSAARLVRDFAIPRPEKNRKNPFAGDEQHSAKVVTNSSAAARPVTAATAAALRRSAQMSTLAFLTFTDQQRRT